MYKKKVTFIYSKMRNVAIAIVMLRLFKLIDKDKYEINLILLEEGGELVSEIPSYVNVTYCKKNSPMSLLKKLDIWGLICWIYWRFREAIASDDQKQCYYGIKLYTIPDTINADCVISCAESNFNLVCLAAYSNANNKILWVHVDKRLSVNEREYRKALERFNHIFCVSSSASRTFAEQFPQVRDRIQTVYNVIDQNEIRLKALEKTDFEMKKYALCTVGRVSEEKGQILIPDTVRMLLKAGYDVYWYLIGDTTDKKYVESIKKIITEFRLDNRIIWGGVKRNPYPYIQNADIYVQPSMYEGYCTATIEAKTLKKPIIASNIPNMHEQFVDGTNGLLVDADSKSLFEAIKKLLDYPNLREKFISELDTWTFDNKAQLEKIYHVIDSE